jgi:hypothetical protein
MESTRPAPPVQSMVPPPLDAADAAPACLNCGEAMVGAYCAACGQPQVDLTATTWHVLRDAVSDATDVDGRAMRTARAIGSPGRLTIEFLRGRRAPYIGPLKLFVAAGAILSTTWVVTRGVDARYYGFTPDASAGAYIDNVVRGLLAAGVTVAVASWLLSRGRRRFLDEAVFALHVVAALALGTAAVIWIGTGWKLAWVSAHRVPPWLPSLVYLVFLPAAAASLAYGAAATLRVYGVAWWVAGLRAVALAAIGLAVIMGAIVTARP